MFNTKTLLLGVLSLLTFMFTACSNEDATVDTHATTMQVALTPEEVLNITYNGITYKNVPIAYDSNGDLIFLDNAFSKIYQHDLANNPHWSVAMKGGNDIEFFTDLNSNLKANGVELSTATEIASSKSCFRLSRSTSDNYYDYATLTLYDDRDYKDRHLDFTLNDTLMATEVRNLKKSPWKFNDKCSSLKIANFIVNDPKQYIIFGTFEVPCSDVDAVFIGYDDRKFTDRTITCVAHAAERKECASLPGFNDKLSSFKFFLAQKGMYASSF